MNKHFRLLSIAGFVLTALIACKEEFHQLKPQIDPITTESICQGPPIKQNIVGTWKVGIRKNKIGDTLSRTVPINSSTFTRIGRLSFDTNNRVTDPDLLLPTEIEIVSWHPFLYYEYRIQTDTTPNGPYRDRGEMFWLYQIGTINGQPHWTTGYFHKVILNECNRIYLKGDTFEIVMVR